MRDQRERLLQAIVDGQRLMDEDVARLDGLQAATWCAPTSGRSKSSSRPERQEETIRDARVAPSMRYARSPPKWTCSARPPNPT